MNQWKNPSDEELRQILLNTKTIAVVGLSENQRRPSYGVAAYLQQQGYRIVPIHPDATTVLGERAYPDLYAVPFAVDLVDIFRRPELVGPHVTEAIEKGASTIWMQLGVRNETAAAQAQQAGLTVVMDRCTKIDHLRLVASRS